MAIGSLGFIGAGAMCNAIVRGVLKAKLVEAKNVHVFDPNDAQVAVLTQLGCRRASSEEAVVKAADVVILAVKPDVVPLVLKNVQSGGGGGVAPSSLIVSVAAGVTIAALEGGLPARSRVVRVMPNTPSLVSEGATVISAGSSSTAADLDVVKQVFSAVGLALVAEEKYLDAVTGLTGSGPAYVFQFIEALADGGVRSGLPRDMAMLLAVQLVKGSAQMVQDTKSHPAELKDKVTSPGGTTIAGVHALEQGGLRAAVINAVYHATLRAKELGSISAKSKL